MTQVHSPFEKKTTSSSLPDDIQSNVNDLKSAHLTKTSISILSISSMIRERMRMAIYKNNIIMCFQAQLASSPSVGL